MAATQPGTLAAYLDRAAAATLFEIELDVTGVKKREVKKLDAGQTKSYLARLDLAQRFDGPVVKCPSNAVLELTDAGGTVLGKIGFCHGHARFDAPDGTFSGIQAALP
jgi:hypothetical protein